MIIIIIICGKQQEATAPIQSLVKRQPWFLSLRWKTYLRSTAVEKVVACALVTQRARVRSPVGTGFLGEVFSRFFLTCKTNVRKL